MRVSNLNLFDENVAGTTTTWYTPSDTYDALGRGDYFTFAASVYNVTPPTNLTVRVECSADGQTWVDTGTAPQINAIAVNSNDVKVVTVGEGLVPVLLTFVRLKTWLTGGGAQCRLKLTATSRTF